MGFFSPIWKVLGFEDDAKQEKKKEVQTCNASFNLSDKNHHKQLPSTRQARNQAEVEKVLEELKVVKTLIIDLSNFMENRQRSLDFISGAVFMLDGELKKVENDKFYCNLNIEEEWNKKQNIT